MKTQKERLRLGMALWFSSRFWETCFGAVHTECAGDIEDQPCTPCYCLVQHLSHRVARLPGGGNACLCVQLSIKAFDKYARRSARELS